MLNFKQQTDTKMSKTKFKVITFQFPSSLFLSVHIHTISSRKRGITVSCPSLSPVPSRVPQLREDKDT